MIDSRRQRVAERILDDERLRGPLTDDAYAPLQGWALAWIDARACATADRSDEEAARALESDLDWIKAQLRSLVSLLARWSQLPSRARSAEIARVASSLAAPALARQRHAIAALVDEVDAATAIAQALRPSTINPS